MPRTPQAQFCQVQFGEALGWLPLERIPKGGWSTRKDPPYALTGSSSHPERHQCSGCAKSDHGAQLCPRAEKI